MYFTELVQYRISRTSRKLQLILSLYSLILTRCFLVHVYTIPSFHVQLYYCVSQAVYRAYTVHVNKLRVCCLYSIALEF